MYQTMRNKSVALNLMAINLLFIELLRENKRMLDKSIRDIERERQGLQSQEKKLIAEIKRTAKQGQMVFFCELKMLVINLIGLREQHSKVSFMLCLPLFYP